MEIHRKVLLHFVDGYTFADVNNKLQQK